MNIDQLFELLPPQLAVMIVAALPVFELRGSLPLGVLCGLSPLQSLLWSLIGNLLPLPLLLYLMPHLLQLLRRLPFTGRILAWLDARERRYRADLRRYGLPALTILVAIPLPGTGLWSGCLAAALLQLPRRKAALAITVGVLIAAAIVFAVTVGGVILLPVLGWWALLLLVVAVTAGLILKKYRRKK